MSEIFRGHLEECLKHLTARLIESFPRGSRSAVRARQPMADFCGVSVHSVTDWCYRSNHLPRGQQYIKLICFLEINGYKVMEFERLSQKIRHFARLIGFGLVTSQEAIEMLGYAETSSLYQLLRGNAGASSEVEEKLWDMWKARRDELDHAIEKATEHYQLDFSTVSNQRSAPSQGEKAATASNGNCPRDGVVDIMQGLLRLLDSGVLQNLSSADWEVLRNSSGTILRLSSHLSTLSARLVKPS